MTLDPANIKIWTDRGVNLGVLICIMLIAHVCARMTWLAVDGVAIPSNNVAPVAVVGSQNEMADDGLQLDVPELLSWNVFGEHLEQAEEPEIEVDDKADVPDTSLSFELQGVSVSDVEDHSSAIIALKKGGKGELFWVGDSVLDKAILNKVFEDKVILKLGSRLETLRFDDQFAIGDSSANDYLSKTSKAAPNQNQSVTQTKHSDMLRSYRSRLNKKNEVAKELGAALNDVNKGNSDTLDALLDQYGTGLESKLERAMKSAGVEEVQTGMRIGPKARSSWLSKAGLRRGDVVKSVNGQSVNVLKSSRPAIDSIVKSCVAKIEVQRGQRTFIVTYPFCKK